MARVAVLGTGRIGLPVAASLARSGHDVHGFDVCAEREAQARAAAVTWAPTASDAVSGAAVVFTVLPGSPELRALMFGSEQVPGVLAALSPGTSWVDLTSTAPDLDGELAVAARERGVRHLDAGVAGGVPAAEQGRLRLYVGGEADLVDLLRPLLSSIADRVHHMGPAGTGHLTKLLINLLWFGQALAVGEALLLAQRAGLDLTRLSDALPGSAASSEFISSALPRLLAGDYLTSFGLERCVEELDSLERLAQETGTPFELSAQVTRGYRQALAEFGAVPGELLGVAHLERLAGQLIRTPQR